MLFGEYNLNEQSAMEVQNKIQVRTVVQEVMGLIPVQVLGFFLCPMCVSCWLIHLSHFVTELKIHHLYSLIKEQQSMTVWLQVLVTWAVHTKGFEGTSHEDGDDNHSHHDDMWKVKVILGCWEQKRLFPGLKRSSLQIVQNYSKCNT